MSQNKPKFSVVIRTDAYQNLINNTLGDKETSKKFVADITTAVSSNPRLQDCETATILSAGLMAQSLGLPLAQGLGFAHLVPYGNKCQLILGYKAYVQLAQRSGQFKSIGVRPVHKGEYAGQDKFGEDLFKFDHQYDNEETVGYFAYFQLTNGFEKTMYWTKEQCEQHAKRYSKSYGNGSDTDNWTKMFDAMAQKTVLKNLLSKYAPLSVDMLNAINYDQSSIDEKGNADYVDKPTDSDISNSLVADN